jgi:hypothetical protein
MLLFLAAAASTLQPIVPVGASAHARAVVRIEQGTELRFAEIEREQPQRIQERTVRSSDGSVQPARLVEFE